LITSDFAPNVRSWAKFVSSTDIREKARTALADDQFLRRMARATVMKAREFLGRPMTEDDDLSAKTELVLSAWRPPLEFHRAILKKVLIDGARINKSATRNWCWDQEIAFCLGAVRLTGGRSITLITDDTMILTTARECGFGGLAISVTQYDRSRDNMSDEHSALGS
jgi:hypothetical protein